jgi:hypothetical protein
MIEDNMNKNNKVSDDESETIVTIAMSHTVLVNSQQWPDGYIPNLLSGSERNGPEHHSGF